MLQVPFILLRQLLHTFTGLEISARPSMHRRGCKLEIVLLHVFLWHALHIRGVSECRLDVPIVIKRDMPCGLTSGEGERDRRGVVTRERPSLAMRSFRRNARRCTLPGSGSGLLGMLGVPAVCSEPLHRLTCLIAHVAWLCMMPC